MHPLWKEYCTKSTLHGLHYVVARGRPMIERIVWLTLMITGALGIVKQLFVSWNLLYNGPVQVIVQNPRFDLHNIDFPAITVCNINKVNAVRANKVFERMFAGNASEENREAFMNSMLAFSLMRYPYYNHPHCFLREDKNRTFYEFKNDHIMDIMKEVNPTVTEMIMECFWRGTGFNCSDLFRPQLTEEGFCHSFNSKTADMSTGVSNITPPFKGKDGSYEVLRNNAAGKITAIELFMKYPEPEHRLPQDTFRPDGYSCWSKF